MIAMDTAESLTARADTQYESLVRRRWRLWSRGRMSTSLDTCSDWKTTVMTTFTLRLAGPPSSRLALVDPFHTWVSTDQENRPAIKQPVRKSIWIAQGSRLTE
jgi:hypothetical protein